MARAKALGHEDSSYVWGIAAKMGGRDELSSDPWFGHPVCWWISLSQKHTKTQECGSSHLCSGVGI